MRNTEPVLDVVAPADLGVSPMAADRRIRSYHCTVRAGERAVVTRRIPPLLQARLAGQGCVRAFYFDEARSFPALEARVDVPPDGPTRGRLEVMIEELIDDLCYQWRWDTAPLVHEDRSDRWEHSIVDVRVADLSDLGMWERVCRAGTGEGGEELEAMCRFVLRLPEALRSHQSRAWPILISTLLATDGGEPRLPEDEVFLHTKSEQERTILRSKVRELRRDGQIVTSPGALQSIEARAHASLRSGLALIRATIDRRERLRALRLLLNLLGYSPKEQDYLVLLGCSIAFHP